MNAFYFANRALSVLSCEA